MSEVTVTESAAIALLNILQSTNSAPESSSQSIAVLKTSLQRVVDKEWGTGGCVRLNTGRWAIDISKYADNRALYLIVESTGGKREAVDVIDEGDLHDSPPQAKEALKAKETIAENDVPVVQRETPMSDPRSEEKVLIRRIHHPDGEVVDSRLVQFGQVPNEIRAMLAAGANAEDIEIWTHMKKPRVKIELE